MFAKGFYAYKTGLVFKKGLRLNDILFRHVPKTNGFSISVVDKRSERYWCKLLVDDLKRVDGNDFGHKAQYDLILCVASSIKSRKGTPYETVVSETLSAYVQNLSPSGVVILYVESNGETSSSQSAIVFEELNKRLAKNEINATYYSERHYVLGDAQHGMYVCVEPYSIRAILNRVAIYSGADERFFHNSLMYWNPIAKKFEEDGTEINVHVKRRDSDDVQFKEAYRSMLEYYARLIDPTNGFLSGSISYYLEQLGYDVLVIKRNDIKYETINRIRQELLDFESNENHEDYARHIVEVEDNSLSARYSEITSKTEGYGNIRESLSLQLERACVALMVLLERIGAYLHGIYVAEMDMGTINKSKLLYMYFDVSRIEESSSHICFKESSFPRVTDYLMGLFLHRSQDKLIYYIQKSQVASVKAAIGSIMSRNGSHNIGSHVLAALSHNVGTMPDDRVFYQYIQQRMEYIANATTGAPSWSQPTMFVGDMMKTLFSQRHLLDHIAESEGLGAWEFQNKNLPKDKITAQARKLEIHIRRIRGKGIDPIELIKYNCLSDPIDLNEDVALAIPGGVAGQHAFFTIIENVIRNAAKHDWSNPPKSTESLKWGPSHEKEIPLGNLKVYIDFEDKEDSGDVEFSIWTNMSDVLENAKSLQDENSLHKKLLKKLSEPFIDEDTGELRRANWGLAEMKISAGYLQGRSIAEIGGIKKCEKPIISPGYYSDKDDPINHLVYKFNVPKPKTILFVVQEADVENSNQCIWMKELTAKLINFGVYVKTYKQLEDEAKDSNYKYPRFDYEYVVVDKIDEKCEKWMMPFRVISINTSELETIPDEISWKSCADMLNKVVASSAKGFDSKEFRGAVNEIKDKVFARWVKYLKSRHIDENEILNLLLTVSGSGYGGGRGLISKRDVVKFVFEETFNSAATSFAGSIKEEEDATILKCAINKLKSHDIGKIVDVDKLSMDKAYAEMVQYQLREWAKRLLPQDDKVRIYLDVVTGHIKDLDDEIAQIEHEMLAIEERIQASNDFVEKNELNQQWNDNDVKLNSIRVEKSERVDDARSKVSLFSRFINYLSGVCDSVEAILCKYAENIVSLPEGFEHKGKHVSKMFCEKWDAAGVEFWKGPRKALSLHPSFTDEEENAGLNDGWKRINSNISIEFARHYDPTTEQIDKNKCIYAEPLSGSQSGFGALENCDISNKQLMVKMIEAAMLRVLILDERVAKFVREHRSEVSKTYESMHIYVADEKTVDAELLVFDWDENSAEKKKEKEKRLEEIKSKAQNRPVPNVDGFVPLSTYYIHEGRESLLANTTCNASGKNIGAIIKKFSQGGKRLYDVLIIHQGIIDKWFPGTANDSKMVERLLQFLNQIFPYVVITTGRGVPANIPDSARMLPFSTIETTLFKKYPEKMLLIDAVMNVLPKGGLSNEH